MDNIKMSSFPPICEDCGEEVEVEVEDGVTMAWCRCNDYGLPPLRLADDCE